MQQLKLTSRWALITLLTMPTKQSQWLTHQTTTLLIFKYTVWVAAANYSDRIIPVLTLQMTQ
jgi:hypothetical protein